MRIAIYLTVFTQTMAFQCFQCNSEVDEDDVELCIDRETDCPDGTEGCSMMMYVSQNDQEIHMRKFCTSPGIPISHYLRMFPGSAMCQNIFTDQGHIRFASILERRRREALPPAPPEKYQNNLLCMCTTSLCNSGTHKEIIDRTVFNVPKPQQNDVESLSLQGLDD